MSAIFMLAFWVYLAGALAIGWRAGDRRDRQVVVAVLAAALGSGAAYGFLEPKAALIAVVILDVLLLAFVSRYALASHRYWPIWFAGIQAAIVFFDLVALALSPFLNLRADLVGGFWSLLALASMAGGLVYDRQRGIRPYVAD